MKQEIKIPPAGESVREVTIGRLLKASGDYVDENDEIVELETEKVNQVVYAPMSGIVTWQVEEGETAVVDSVIGYIESEGRKERPGSEKKGEVPTTPKPTEQKVEASIKEKPIESFTESEGRREKPDSEKKEESPKKQMSATGKKETRKKMSRLRQVVAARLVESLHTSAMLTTFNEVDMSAVMHARAQNKEGFLQKYGVKLGMTSFFVQATLLALKEFPLLNAYIDGDEIVQREYYDIGVAVSTDRGLVVPVLRACDTLSFVEIEQGIEGYAKKAREGRLRVEDLEGGGFTISNGGVFGSLLSTPILNPPQVGILGMHRIEKRAVVIEDQIVIRPMMYLALSYDHRIIDGKDAILFLGKVKEVLENFSTHL